MQGYAVLYPIYFLFTVYLRYIHTYLLAAMRGRGLWLLFARSPLPPLGRAGVFACGYAGVGPVAAICTVTLAQAGWDACALGGRSSRGLCGRIPPGGGCARLMDDGVGARDPT